MYVISFCLFKRDEINSVSYLAHNKCCKYESALYAQYTCMLCLQLIYMCCCNIIAFRFDLVHAKAFTTCEQQNIHTCYKSKPTKGMNSFYNSSHVISYRRTIGTHHCNLFSSIQTSTCTRYYISFFRCIITHHISSVVVLSYYRGGE